VRNARPHSTQPTSTSACKGFDKVERIYDRNYLQRSVLGEHTSGNQPRPLAPVDDATDCRKRTTKLASDVEFNWAQLLIRLDTLGTFQMDCCSARMLVSSVGFRFNLRLVCHRTDSTSTPSVGSRSTIERRLSKVLRIANQRRRNNSRVVCAD